jgi:hypothetical protein
MKPLMVLLACVVVLVALAAVAGYVLWQRYGDTMIVTVQQAAQDGQRTAESGTDVDCFERSIELLKRCDDFDCSIYTRAFAQSCFAHVSRSADLCARVPHGEGFTRTMTWIAGECPKLAPNNSQCGAVLQDAVAYCDALPQ